MASGRYIQIFKILYSQHKTLDEVGKIDIVFIYFDKLINPFFNPVAIVYENGESKPRAFGRIHVPELSICQ